MKSELRIIAGYGNGKSYLKDAFYTIPYRVVNVGQYEPDQSLYLMTMSSSPGILDTDDYRIDITIEENARLQLQSQSYQRLYQMKEGSNQYTTVNMMPNSVFSYVPHPIVPHQNSKFHNKNRFEMSTNCTLIFSEIITCGRKLSGEVFMFSHFQNLTEVFYQGKLFFKDNVWLEPQKSPLNILIQLENYTHQAALIYLSTNEQVVDIDVEISNLQQILSEVGEIEFEISALSECGFVIRVLANGGEQIYQLFKNIERKLWNKSSIKKDEIQKLAALN